MAERYPEEEERKVPCTLCPNAYKSAKALLRHLRDNHANAPGLKEAIQKVPKDPCPFCGEGRANLVVHKRVCARNPDVQKARPVVPPVPPPRVPATRGTPPPVPPPPRVPPTQQQQQQRPPHPYEKLSNAEIVDKFTDRLLHRLKLDAKGTVPDYERHLKQFIEHETSEDPQFRAFHWFVVGTRQNRDPRFKPIRELQEYIQALIRDQGRKTVERMLTVYTHLHAWIDEHLNEQLADPISLHKQRAANAKEIRAVAKRCGAYKPGQGSKEYTDTVTKHLDVNIVRNLLSVFVNSPLMQQTMETFSGGTFFHVGCTDKKCMDTRCRLGIKTVQDAQNFLALAIFLSNFGTRLDVVMNVTLGALRRAAHALDVCPHCGGHYMYAEHKKLCHR